MSPLDELAQSLGFANYAAYLKSPDWLEFRAANMKRHCFCCFAENGLQLHHLRYHLGEERPEDVVTVCDDCHGRIHDIIRSGKSRLEAHRILRKYYQNKKKDRRWATNWRQLLNKSAGETLTHLQAFLVKNRLLDGQMRPTLFAIKAKYARDANGQWQWHRHRYAKLMGRAKKREKKRLRALGYFGPVPINEI